MICVGFERAGGRAGAMGGCMNDLCCSLVGFLYCTPFICTGQVARHVLQYFIFDGCDARGVFRLFFS